MQNLKNFDYLPHRRGGSPEALHHVSLRYLLEWQLVTVLAELAVLVPQQVQVQVPQEWVVSVDLIVYFQQDVLPLLDALSDRPDDLRELP